MIYVSAQRGDDANPGTFAQPFREIAKAIEHTPAGETVVVLDSGEYAAFRVGKSLAIVADGVHAQIHPGSGSYADPAVAVNAGAADVVALRGLTIRGRDSTCGVQLTSGGTLHVDRCTISGFVLGPDGFPAQSIEVEQGMLEVEDTVLRDNATGIVLHGGRAVVDRCSVRGDGTRNATGLEITGDAHVTVRGSLVSHHGDVGIYIRGGEVAGSPAPLLTLTDSVITHNRIGIYADRTGQVHLARTTVTLNESAGLFTLNDGVVYTAGNNSVMGNLSQNIGGGAKVLFFKSDITS